MLKEIVFPFVIFIIFFLSLQLMTDFGELITTLVAIFLIIVTFLVKKNRGEIRLFVVGILLGLFTEVVLTIIGHVQYFENISYLPVPVWLILAWGFGFVVITRIGVHMRKL